MASYYFNVSIISRGAPRKNARKRTMGRSVTGAAAYITKQKLHDCYTERTYDRRSYRGSVPVTGIYLPPEAPQKFHDLQTVLNALNVAEKRKDAQMARSFILALPIELSLE